MIRGLYRQATRPLFLLYSPFLLFRLFTRPEYRKGIRQRLGYELPEIAPGSIWIHAVSVGEVITAVRLVREFNEKSVPVILSVTTPTGYDVAISKLSGHATIIHFPIDLPGAVKRSVRGIKPSLLVTIDTEIWPNAIWEVKKSGAAVAIVNGRISDRSYPRYKRLNFLFKEALESVDLLLMQSDADVNRIINIGANPTSVFNLGNIKFDSENLDETEKPTRLDLRKSLGIGPDEQVIMLGSLHEGEDQAITSAIHAIKKKGSGRLVIAPRRIENIDWITNILEKEGFIAERRSGANPNPDVRPDLVPVIDTFGELGLLYSVADIVFTGGSLIDHGGQNPLEPASHAIAPIFGPNMCNFSSAVKALLEVDGAWQVGSSEELPELFNSLLLNKKKRGKHGQAALEVVMKNRGVTKRVAERLMKLIEQP